MLRWNAQQVVTTIVVTFPVSLALAKPRALGQQLVPGFPPLPSVAGAVGTGEAGRAGEATAVPAGGAEGWKLPGLVSIHWWGAEGQAARGADSLFLENSVAREPRSQTGSQTPEVTWASG